MNIGILLDMVADTLPERVLAQVGEHTYTGAALPLAATALGAEVRRVAADEVVFIGENGPVLPIVLFGAAIAGVPTGP